MQPKTQKDEIFNLFTSIVYNNLERLQKTKMIGVINRITSHGESLKLLAERIAIIIKSITPTHENILNKILSVNPTLNETIVQLLNEIDREQLINSLVKQIIEIYRWKKNSQELKIVTNAILDKTGVDHDKLFELIASPETIKIKVKKIVHDISEKKIFNRLKELVASIHNGPGNPSKILYYLHLILLSDKALKDFSKTITDYCLQDYLDTRIIVYKGESLDECIFETLQDFWSDIN